MKEIRVFTKSLLKTLDYAHSLGINNMDLSASNVRMNQNGEAIVMDWNANRYQGEQIWDGTANMWLTAPEGMLEHANGTDILQESIPAMDIWSTGVMVVNLAYAGSPCLWINPSSVQRPKNSKRGYPRNYHLLRQTLIHIGGDPIIPIGSGKTFDIAALVGLNRSELLTKEFDLPLYNDKRKTRCNLTSTDFPILKNANEKDLKEMHAFIKTMMKISPADRPDASTMLKHPFLSYSDS